MDAGVLGKLVARSDGEQVDIPQEVVAESIPGPDPPCSSRPELPPSGRRRRSSTDVSGKVLCFEGLMLASTIASSAGTTPIAQTLHVLRPPGSRGSHPCRRRPSSMRNRGHNGCPLVQAGVEGSPLALNPRGLVQGHPHVAALEHALFR